VTPPADLAAALTALLGDARLGLQALPDSDLSLWLIDPANMARAFSPAETQRLLEAPPYWAFCWASGLALARWIAAHPEHVAGRQVLDFGSGSGIAGLAAARAGATRVVCCDLAHPGFTRIATLQACTLPDLAEPDEFRRVALYRS